MWGSCFWFCTVSRLLLLLRTIFRTAIFHTTTFSHTIFHTTIFLTTTFSHTIFHTKDISHTISHTTHSFTQQLSHTQSFTTTFSATHNLSHNNFLTRNLSPTALSHPVARLCPADLRFAWQAWHLLTSTFVLRGRHGAYDTGLDLAARLGAVAPRHFAWQAWHLATSTLRLRGRRGTCSHQPSFCVAGVAFMILGWIWWRTWAPLVAPGAAALCVAGVALGGIDVAFAWQAWHLLTSTFVLRGRCGACLARREIGLAGDALGCR